MKNQKIFNYYEVSPKIIRFILLIYLLNSVTFGYTWGITPNSIEKQIKTMFTSELNKKHKFYKFSDIYTIYKDNENNEVSRKDKNFKTKVVKAEALIKYYVKDSNNNDALNIVVLSYDLKNNQLKKLDIN